MRATVIHGGYFGIGGEADGAQAEASRVPLADGNALPASRERKALKVLIAP
jgi:hypothetical protein